MAQSISAEETIPLKVLVFQGASAERRTWMWYMPGPEIIGNKKDAGLCPRIKNTKNEWKFKSSMPDAKGLGQYRAFTIGTVEPKWRDQIVQRLGQVNVPKAEDITNYEAQAQQWHAQQTQNQQAQLQAQAQLMQQQNPGQPVQPPQVQPIAMPDVPGLPEFQMMMSDPALRSKAWVNEGISNLAMWTLPGPNNVMLPSPINWEWKGLWNLAEEPFLPPELEKFDEYHRTLTVRADDDGQKIFYYRGQRWTEVPVEETPCKVCSARERTDKPVSKKKGQVARVSKKHAQRKPEPEPEPEPELELERGDIDHTYDNERQFQYKDPLSQLSTDEDYVSPLEDEGYASEPSLKNSNSNPRRVQDRSNGRQTTKAPRADNVGHGYGNIQPRPQRQDTSQRGMQPRRQNTMRQVEMDDDDDFEDPAPLQRSSTAKSLIPQGGRRQNTMAPSQVDDYDDSDYEGQPTPMYETAPHRRQATTQRGQAQSLRQARPPPPQVDDYDSGYESNPAPLKRAGTIRTAPQRTGTMNNHGAGYQQPMNAFSHDTNDYDDDFQPQPLRKSMTDPRLGGRGNQAAVRKQQSLGRVQQALNQEAPAMGIRRQGTLTKNQGEQAQAGIRRQNTAPMRTGQGQRMGPGGDDERPDMRARQQMKRETSMRQQGLMNQMDSGSMRQRVR